MRSLLLLALLLYDIVAFATRNYDYEEIDGKRHSLIDERRNWRKKALVKPIESIKDWRRREEDSQRYAEEPESKGMSGMDRQKEFDPLPGYRDRSPHTFDELDKLNNIPSVMKSAEMQHPAAFLDKEIDKKISTAMNCERQHERYEACFAGCASVSCDNPRDRLRPCYPFCEPGCICVHPYVRDDRTHKCVLPEDCTKGLKGIPDLGDDT